MIEHTFFLPIFTAAIDEKYFRPMKFAQNNNPTFLFGINVYTRLFGTWEYVEI